MDLCGKNKEQSIPALALLRICIAHKDDTSTENISITDICDILKTEMNECKDLKAKYQDIRDRADAYSRDGRNATKQIDMCLGSEKTLISILNKLKNCTKKET